MPKKHFPIICSISRQSDTSVVEGLFGPPDGFTQRLTLLSIFDFLIPRIPDQIRTPPWKGAS